MILEIFKKIMEKWYTFRNFDIQALHNAETFTIPEEKWDSEVKIRIGAGDMFTLLNAALPALQETAAEEEIASLYIRIASQLARQKVVTLFSEEEAEQHRLEQQGEKVHTGMYL